MIQIVDPVMRSSAAKVYRFIVGSAHWTGIKNIVQGTQETALTDRVFLDIQTTSVLLQATEQRRIQDFLNRHIET